MCGFASIVSLTGEKINSEQLKRMSHVIRHRGPNSDGVYIKDAVGFAFRRLSIQDLSDAGSQPMQTPDQRYAIVFNGEIYNYIELREELIKLGFQFRSKSDTEVLLNAYIAWGKSCVDKFNGMWAFLIYDSKKKTVFGSRDRFGIKPLYYYRSARHILFGSEIKAIRASGLCKTDINWAMASRFLLEDRLDDTTDSFFENIQSIPPGSVFEINAQGTLSVSKFWSLEEMPREYSSNPIETYREIFDDAVRLRLRADVPQGVFLSGGIDSTSIVCEVARLREEVNSNEPLKAFSFIHDEFDESPFIKETINQTGCELNRVTNDALQLWQSLDSALWYHDEPLHSLTALIGFNLSKMAAEHGTTVILNGQGADETCAGYPSYFVNYWHGLIASGNIKKAWDEIGVYAKTFDDNQKALFKQTLTTFVKSKFRSVPLYRKFSSKRKYARVSQHRWFTDQFTNQLPFEHLSRAREDLHSALIDSTQVAPLPLYLRVEDRNSMAHGIEVRLPFLDYRLVSFLFTQVRDEDKINSCWNKSLMREAMKNKIPENVRMRKDKMGFPIPAQTWVNEKLYEFYLEVLTDDSMKSRGMYNIDVMLKDLERNRRNEIDISEELFDVIQFELWIKNVVEAPEYVN